VAAAKLGLAYAPCPVHASNTSRPRGAGPVIRLKVPVAGAGLECPSRSPRETAMEVLLLLLDEIDDFCMMVWQRASMLLG